MNETFLIIDGSSLIHRAFFALPSFTNKKASIQVLSMDYAICS